ncbi:MAG: TonB-dependent receptor [Acidobacteriota bacterium]|nr:TonB-dependent receptor [Acidobacteriota bacterium]MDE3263774.1 TonB-dependent receptor [Acidobacteriota bacterium]
MIQTGWPKAFRTITLAALVVQAASALVAQDEGAEPAEAGDQDGSAPEAVFYETATVRARALDAATASVQVIEADELRHLAVRDAAEALRQVPGAWVLGNDSSAALAGVSLRGGDANFSLVLIDGVPMADSTDQYGGAFPLGSVGAAEIERLEVVRGPLSSFYGSSSLAGAVQLITAAPRDEAPFLGWSAHAGDHDHLSSRLSWGRAGESSHGSINAAVREEQGRVGEDALEQQTLSARWGRNLGEASALRLSGRFSDWKTDDYSDGSGGPVFGSGELRESDHGDLGLAATVDFGAGEAWSHTLRSTFYEHTLDRISPPIIPLVPPITESTEFNDLRVAWTGAFAPAGGASYDVSLGVEGLVEEGRNQSLLLLPPYFGGPLAGDYLIERERAGAFAEWRWSRGGFVAELGARADFFEGEGEEVSPRLGLRYTPEGGAWSVRASAGEAFKLPSLYALATPRAIGGNPDLEAETSAGADVGIEFRASDASVRGGLTLFSNRFENLIDFDFDTFQIVNRSKVDAEGVEAFLVWNPSARVGVDIRLTSQDTEDLATGRTLRRRPDLYGGIGLRVDLSESIRVGLDARHTGSYLDEQIPAPFRTSVAGRDLVGLSLAWQAADRWRISLRADNAFDEAYETQVGFPGPERSVRIGIRYGQ